MFNRLSIASLTLLSVVSNVLFPISVFAAGEQIIINEIAAYESTGNEWIEIYNVGTNAVDLTGWKFWEGNANHSLTVTRGSFVLAAGDYAVIAQDGAEFVANHVDMTGTVLDSSWGTLNESGEEVGLKDASGLFIEQFTYIEDKDFSLERIDPVQHVYTNANWKEHVSGHTAGKLNSGAGGAVPVPTVEPVAWISGPAIAAVGDTVTFDATGSQAGSGTIASYAWDFDDGGAGTGVSVTHQFTTAGDYGVRLTVMNSTGASTSTEHAIGVIPTVVSSGGVVINEFVPNPNDGEKEWIELYNTSSSAIDLTGWKLEDATGGTIASPTSTVQSHGFVVVTLSSAKLNNGGDTVRLKNPMGQVADEIIYGTEQALIAGKGQSVARVADGIDSDTIADFALTTTPTTGTANVITAVMEVVSPLPASVPVSSGSTGSGGSVRTFALHDLVINELVSDPGDGMEEFVELFNTTASTIVLDGWHLEDGSETETVLSGTVESKKIFLIERPKGSLNNAGDAVVLFDPSGKEIDRVTYGSWDDGNTSDNAVVANDPYSLARKVDGQDSDNDVYDFVLTATLTPGKSNVISLPKDAVVDTSIPATVIGNVLINEIAPNPKGSDSDDEFIELKNTGKETVNLKDWRLGDSSARKYTITQGSVAPGGLIVFKRKMTGIALNNTGGDDVKVFTPSGAIADQAHYSGAAIEEQSYARGVEGVWHWTTKPTPEKENVFVGINGAPVIALDVETEVVVGEPVRFDASDTTSDDGGTLLFSWEFGDGSVGTGVTATHVYLRQGVFQALVIAVAGTSSSTKRVAITVKDPLSFVGGAASDVSRILISEIFPNPAGSDDREFIELFNPTELPIDLSGFKLDDEDGGSKPYTIPEGTMIAAGEYTVFKREITKLALNNTTDTVRLLTADGDVVTEVEFEGVKEDLVYVWNGKMWSWSSTITPGEPNTVTLVAGIKTTKWKGAGKKAKIPLSISLDTIHEQDVGDLVHVTGVVSAVPGVFGAQYFYIASERAPIGVQIYMYKKEFPMLAIGDKVEIVGEVAESSGEMRIKVAAKTDIKKVGSGAEIKPNTVTSEDVGEITEGSLVVIAGEVTEIKKTYLYLDDGLGEVKVYFKKGAAIDTKQIGLGDLVTATGIVNQTKAGYQLLPRSQSDIQKTGRSTELVMEEKTEENQTAAVAETYLTTTAGGLTALFLGLVAKTRGSAAVSIGKKILTIVQTVFKKFRA